MFEDHWYEHSTLQEPLPQVTLSLRRSESVKRQSLDSPRSSREIVREKPKPPKRKIPELPQPTVLRRPTSYNDFTELRSSQFSLVGGGSIQAHQDDPKGPPAAQVPPRPRSRNDMNTGVISRRIDGKHIQGVNKELDLMQWYERVEEELQDANNHEYRLFLATIQSQLWTCQHLLETTDDTLFLLASLKNSFVDVENQTSSFQTQCEDLVSEEERLETLSQQIGRGLAPFTELETMVTKLNRPGTEFVKTRSFSDMLKTLDWCLEDLGKYSHFKDTHVYLPRFRRCMTISMTLIRNYLVNSLREISADVSKRMTAKNLTETTQSALLYARFRVNAPELRDLVAEIEKRCSGHEEYVSLLNDCYNSFFASRRPLITPLTTKKMTEITTSNVNSNDLVALARSCISDMKSICNDEFELFYAYFSTGEREVYIFLESICKPLYDRLRPRIAAETQLVKLCELCTLLQTRYVRDQEDAEYDSYDRVQLDFGRLIQTILLDTQTRLVAGAQVVLKTAIEQFIPSVEDLDYPAKVANQPNKKNVPTPVVVETDDNLGTAGGFDTDAVFQGWYPTLRKAIWLLSRIYRLVNPTVFGDIAHKIVHSCTLSLIKASKQLTREKTAVDGHLFLVKHLLILKEQILAFDIEYLPASQEKIEVQETLTGTFWDVYQKGGLFTRDGILKLVSVGAGWTGGPVENMIDAKVELDGTLRTAINSFTADYAGRMLSPVLTSSPSTEIPQMASLQGSVQSTVGTSSILNPNWQPQIPPQRISSPISVRSQSSNRVIVPDTGRSPTPLPPPATLVFAPTSQFTEKTGGQLMQEIQSNIESEVRNLRGKLQEYAVGDWRTREALVGAVQELVINKYESFFSQLLQDTSTSSGGTGSISYRDVWDVEKFVGWSNDIFDVGKGIMEGGIQDDREVGEEEEGLGITMNGEEGRDYTDDGGGDGE